MFFKQKIWFSSTRYGENCITLGMKLLICYYQLLTVIRRLLDWIELRSTCIPNVYYHPNAYCTCIPYGSILTLLLLNWAGMVVYNRPLPWCSKPRFQSEARCEAIDVKMIYYKYSHANKTHFHKKGFALTLVLRVRIFGTRKWPVSWLCTSAWTIFWVFPRLILKDEFYSKRAFLVYIILVYIANMVVYGIFFYIKCLF